MRLAQVLELGLQLDDGRAHGAGLGGQPSVRRLDVRRVAVALAVDAVQGEVLVVAAPHGGLEAFDRGSLVAQRPGLAGGDLGSVEFVLGRGVDDEQFGGLSSARERGVGPVAREVLGATDNARPLDGGPLESVRGQHVAVLHMLGHIGAVEAALGAGVGAHHYVLLGWVDGDHGAPHPVVDGALAVVATRDDAITHREVAATDVDALAEPAVALELGADERVEALAALVVTHDQDGLPPLAGGLALAPRGHSRVLTEAGARGLGGMEVQAPAGRLFGQVVGGVAAPDLGQQLAFARVALTHHLAQLVRAQPVGE